MTGGARPFAAPLVALLGALLPVVAAAQFGTVDGPILGYVTERSQGLLRPIHGVLGSATIGSPVAFDDLTTRAYALDARRFLVSTAAGVSAVDARAKTIRAVPVEGAQPNPSDVIASPNASAAALHYAERREVAIVAGLPAAPAISHVVALPPSLGTAKHVVVHDDGSLLVVAVTDGVNDTIYAWTAAAPALRFITSARSVTAMAMDQSGDTLIADGAANELFWIRDVRDTGVRQHFADAASGLSSPNGLAVTRNGQVFVANAGSSVIHHFTPDGALANIVGCSCQPSGIYAFDGTVYRLTDRTDQTIYLLDTGGGSGGRVIFLPPLRTE